MFDKGLRVIRRVGLQPSDFVFLFALIIAFINAYRATHDLQWGYSPDIYRDVGMVRAILNGSFPSDPLYIGEYNWYNPLLPAIVAFISNFVDLPIHVLYTRAGPYLNIFTPITFYILATCLFKRRIALFSALAYLFIIGEVTNATYTATYSAWLFTVNFTQAFFFASLIAYIQASRTQKLHWYAIFGALLGITFLSHTAPALMLGIIFILTMLPRLYRVWDGESPSPEMYRVILRLIVPIGVAFIISAPLSITILGHYHLHILNVIPGAYTADVLRVANAPSFLGSYITIVSLVALVGLVSVTKWRDRKIEKQTILLWLTSILLLLSYDYIKQLLEQNGVLLPTIVPSWHYVIYLEAVKALLFGYGLWILTQLTVGLTHNITSIEILKRPYWQYALASLLMAGFLIMRYPQYLQRDDFVFAREESLRIQNIMVDRAEAYRWVYENTSEDAVFLTSDNHLSMFVVAQAGRKVVVAPPTYSNPYVDMVPRATNATMLLDALQNGDQQGFLDLAELFGLNYVILSNEIRPIVEEQHLPFLEQVFSFNEVTIYALREM